MKVGIEIGKKNKSISKKEEGMCYDLASFLCYPDSIGIGTAADQLVDVIRNMTVGNKTIRDKVFELCEYKVSEGFYNSDAYESDDITAVMSMIKEDYNARFFKK